MTDTPANDGFGTISVAAILAESAARFPQATALIVGDEETTYGQLWEQTRAYAGALRARGIGPGDPVALLIPNVADFARAYYAVLALGGVVVPVHALLKAHEIEHVMRDSGASLLICAASLLGEGAPGAAAAGVEVLTVMAPEGTAGRLEAEAAAAPAIQGYVPRRPQDTATILYTSGTTGKPKGALGTHFALMEQVNVLLTSTFDLRPGDKVFGGLPLFHTFGQTCVPAPPLSCAPGSLGTSHCTCCTNTRSTCSSACPPCIWRCWKPPRPLQPNRRGCATESPAAPHCR